MKVLITGFEPFNEETLNPSAEAVKKLGTSIAGAKVVKAILPTVFRKSLSLLQEIVEQEQPDVTICVGQAGGSHIKVERVAINLLDADKPDNDEQKPIDEPMFDDGPAAYFSNLPVKAIVEELRKQKIPAAVSNSAGTYVCNQTMYGLLYMIDWHYPDMKGGFIHVPFLHEQVLEKTPIPPSMALSTLVNALEIAIKVSIA